MRRRFLSAADMTERAAPRVRYGLVSKSTANAGLMRVIDAIIEARIVTGRGDNGLSFVAIEVPINRMFEFLSFVVF